MVLSGVGYFEWSWSVAYGWGGVALSPQGDRKGPHGVGWGPFYDIMLDRYFLLRLEQLLDKGLCKPGLVFFC